MKTPIVLKGYHWHWAQLLSMRGFIAAIGILMGLGRIFAYGLSASISFGISEMFGAFLLTGGLALLLTIPIRLTVLGRMAATYAVFCYALMGAGTFGNNASNLYLLCAVGCIIEALSRRGYDC
jgi:hypothetical protein